MQATTLKKELTTKLLSISNDHDKSNRMHIALNLKCSLATVDRYFSGQVRDLERAENIIEEAEKLVSKSTSNTVNQHESQSVGRIPSVRKENQPA